jgi:hypothetical protein
MKKSARSLSEKEEKRVNAVFYCRYKSISGYAIRKRVPRQIHYAIAKKHNNCSGK